MKEVLQTEKYGKELKENNKITFTRMKQPIIARLCCQEKHDVIAIKKQGKLKNCTDMILATARGKRSSCTRFYENVAPNKEILHKKYNQISRTTNIDIIRPLLCTSDYF